MAAMGVLMFRLISDSQQGNADACASGLVSAATSVYQSELALARADAEALARDNGRFRGRALATRFSALAREAGFARVTLTAGARALAEVGDTRSIAPGAAVLVQP